MSNYNTIKQLIKSFSGRENIIGCPLIYFQLTEDLEAAIFLSQLIYWSDKGGRQDGWFYKSYADWERELALSAYKVKRITKKLKDMGILQTKVKKANGAPTIHYRFDYEKFENLIVKFLRIHYEETSQSITETTTEITTDNNTLGVADATPLAVNPEAETPVKTRQANPQDMIRKALEDRFCELTGLPHPLTDTAQQARAAGRLWFTPLREIAKLADWQAVDALSLLEISVKKLLGEVTISDPNSIIKTARGVAAGTVPGVRWKRGAAANERKTTTMSMVNPLTGEIETMEVTL